MDESEAGLDILFYKWIFDGCEIVDWLSYTFGM